MSSGDRKQPVLSKPGIAAFGKYLPPECCLNLLGSSEAVTQLCSWGRLSAVICASGRAYTFGQSDHLAWMRRDAITEPTLVTALAGVRVMQVACGAGMAVFLGERGEVYTCGANDCGQLGLRGITNAPSPILIRGLPPIQKVATGSEHTVLLTANREVWVTGRNNIGQLGLGHTSNQETFTLVPDIPESIVDILCGSWHTTLLTASKGLLMAGRNKDHELALSGMEISNKFQPVSLTFGPIAAIACGYSHTVALSADGTVTAWGRNNVGQLGIGKEDKSSSPMTVMLGLEGKTIARVFAGGNHTALLTTEGDILVCGHGRLGELGLNKEDFLVPTMLSKAPGLVVQQVVFAQEYTLMLVVPKYATMKHEAGQVSSYVTDWERSLTRSLECPLCFKIMCAPIHQCFKGHNLCGSCFSHLNTLECPSCHQPFIPGKNIALESLAAEVQLPCMDCLQRMPVVALEGHASECPRRQYSCPLEQTCGWSGRPGAMLGHASSIHPQQTWQDLPHMFSHAMSDQLLRTDLLAANNEIFTFHRRYSSTENEIQFAVRYIGLPEYSSKFRFRLEFNVDSEEWNISAYKKVSSDLHTYREMFQFLFCASLNKDIAESYVRNDNLSCRVSIFKAGQ